MVKGEMVKRNQYGLLTEDCTMEKSCIYVSWNGHDAVIGVLLARSKDVGH